MNVQPVSVKPQRPRKLDILNAPDSSIFDDDFSISENLRGLVDEADLAEQIKLSKCKDSRSLGSRQVNQKPVFDPSVSEIDLPPEDQVVS